MFKKLWFQYFLGSIGFFIMYSILSLESNFELTDIIYQTNYLGLTYLDIMVQGAIFILSVVCIAGASYYFYVGETVVVKEEFEIPEGEEDFLNLTKEEKEELNKREEAALKQLADYEASILIK